MADFSLRQYSLRIAASTVTAQLLTGNLDWRFDGNQTRRFVVTLAQAADSVLLEGTLDDGVTWFPLNAAYTGATTPYVLVTVGPIMRVRATKTGTAGAATVVAIA